MESQLYLLGGLGSFLMGATLGVFGAGGSILTVPLLVFLFQLPSSEATHYSLFIVGMVSAFGFFLDRKNAFLPIRDLSFFAIPAMLGMYLMRAIVIPNLPSNFEISSIGVFTLNDLILVIFALFMIAASFSMLFIKIQPRKNVVDHKRAYIGPVAALALMGILVGMLTGFVGAGGGFLIVPALVFLAKFSMSDAVRASLFVIMLNSLLGFFSSSPLWELIPWSLLFFIVLVALGGMLLGLRFRRTTKLEQLKPAFGAFVLFVGSYILWRAF